MQRLSIVSAATLFVRDNIVFSEGCEIPAEMMVAAFKEYQERTQLLLNKDYDSQQISSAIVKVLSGDRDERTFVHLPILSGTNWYRAKPTKTFQHVAFKYKDWNVKYSLQFHFHMYRNRLVRTHETCNGVPVLRSTPKIDSMQLHSMHTVDNMTELATATQHDTMSTSYQSQMMFSMQPKMCASYSDVDCFGANSANTLSSSNTHADNTTGMTSQNTPLPSTAANKVQGGSIIDLWSGMGSSHALNTGATTNTSLSSTSLPQTRTITSNTNSTHANTGECNVWNSTPNVFYLPI
jgi:hypothetical protein